MTKEQFGRELDYGAKAYITRKLLSAGLITEREFGRLCAKYECKYHPLIGGYIPSDKSVLT